MMNTNNNLNGVSFRQRRVISTPHLNITLPMMSDNMREDDLFIESMVSMSCFHSLYKCSIDNSSFKNKVLRDFKYKSKSIWAYNPYAWTNIF